MTGLGGLGEPGTGSGLLGRGGMGSTLPGGCRGGVGNTGPGEGAGGDEGGAGVSQGSCHGLRGDFRQAGQFPRRQMAWTAGRAVAMPIEGLWVRYAFITPTRWPSPAKTPPPLSPGRKLAPTNRSVAWW